MRPENITPPPTIRLFSGNPASLLVLASLLLVGSIGHAQAAHPQDTPKTDAAPAAAANTGTPAAAAKSPEQIRADAYFHAMMAHGYEEQAVAEGAPELVNKAIDEYKLALAGDPTSSELNDGLAELYFRAGRVRESIETTQAEIARNPDSLEAHKLLGRIYLRSLGEIQNGSSNQMLQLAIGEYSKIVQLEPNNIENHLLLGQLYGFAKDNVHAQQQFQAAQAIDPHSEEVVLNMARIDTEQGDFNGAIQVLSSMPADDQTAKTEYALGASYDQIHDTKKAIAAYQKSLALEPDNLDVERALAEALQRDGQDKAALDAYNDIIEGDPTDASAYLSAAKIDRSQGRLDDALAKLKKAAPLAPNSMEIKYEEARAYEATGQYPEAERLLTSLVSQSEHTTNDYSPAEKNNYAIFVDLLANVYNEEGRTDDAVNTFGKLVPLGTEYATSAYASQVDSLRQAHQYDKATQLLQAASAKDPKNRDLKLMLAPQLASTGKTDEGVNVAKSVLNNSPDDRAVYLTLAQIYFHAKKWKDAGEALDKAEQLSTHNNEKSAVYQLRAMVEDRQQHFDAAEAAYKKALAVEPENSTTLNDYGYMLADRDTRLPEALQMIQKAVRLDPQNYANLDSLGWTYFKMGQFALAEGNLLKASQRNGQEPTVHEHLGDVYEKTGRLRQAASEWEESLRLYQKSDPADGEPGEGNRLQKKLDSARVKLAKMSPDGSATNAADKHH